MKLHVNTDLSLCLLHFAKHRRRAERLWRHRAQYGADKRGAYSISPAAPPRRVTWREARGLNVNSPPWHSHT